MNVLYDIYVCNPEQQSDSTYDLGSAIQFRSMINKAVTLIAVAEFIRYIWDWCGDALASLQHSSVHRQSFRPRKLARSSFRCPKL